MQRLLRSVAVALTSFAFVLAHAGCGDDDSGAADGGSRDAQLPDYDGALAEPAPPIAPAPPAPVVLTPCPPGWIEVPAADESGVAICEPWPEGVAPCGPGEALFPGESACAPLGSACPAGEWPEGLPTASPVIYVRPGAVGGDGTRELPFGTPTEAMASVTVAGTTIALARGTHVDSFSLRGGVTVRGVCARDTILRARPGSNFVVAMGGSSMRTLRDVSIEGPGMGAAMESGAATLEGVEIRGADPYAIALSGGSIVARRVAVYDTGLAPDGRFGRGVEVHGTASFEAEQLIVEGSGDYGIAVSGVTARVSDVVIRGGRGNGRGFYGTAAAVQLGGTLEIDRAVIEANRTEAVTSGVDASTLTVRDSIVRGTIEQVADGELGGAILCRGGTTILERVRISDNRHYGLGVIAPGRFEARDVVIERTGTETHTGLAVLIDDGASGSIERGLIRDTHGLGGGPRGPGAMLVATDLTVLRTSGDAAGTAGLVATRASALIVERAEIVEAAHAGIQILSGATATLQDVAVRGTVTLPVDFGSGLGLLVAEGGNVSLARASFERNAAVAVGVTSFDPETGSPSMLDAEDLVIRETRPAYSGNFGRGIDAQYGAQVTLRRSIIEDCREAAIAVSNPATFVRASDTVVARTAPAECAGDCRSAPAVGIFVFDGGHVDLERFRIEDNGIVGVQLRENASVDLRVGRVTGHPIGVNLQVAGYDVSRLTDRVYWDNVSDLDTSALPVPESNVDVQPTEIEP